MRNLIVSVEAYPDLKSNTNFLELQRQLAETEDRIANGRRYYNANVRVYNTKVESVPTNIIANIFKFEKATYFEVNDPAVRQAPDVSFGEIAYRGDSRWLRPRAAAAPSVGAAVQFGQPSDDSLPNPQQYQQQPQQSHISSRRSSSPRSTSRHLRPPAAAAASADSSAAARDAESRPHDCGWAGDSPASGPVTHWEGGCRHDADDLPAARTLGADGVGGRPRLQQLRRADGRRGRADGRRRAALDAGITLFDTADVYGDAGAPRPSRRGAGAAVATRSCSRPSSAWTGRRQRTGLGRARVAPLHPARRRALSLRRLGTDWIDLYQLHRPTRHPDRGDAGRARLSSCTRARSATSAPRTSPAGR